MQNESEVDFLGIDRENGITCRGAMIHETKGVSIPTRFGQSEAEALQKLSAQSGLSKSEIVRRAVRLLLRESERRGSVGFILDLLNRPADVSYTIDEPRQPALRVAEESASAKRP